MAKATDTDKIALQAVKQRKIKSRYSDMDLQATGPKPEWDDIATLSEEALAKRWADGLYFYYYHHNIKDFRQYIVQVLGIEWTLDEVRAFNKIKDWMLGSQLGAMCKMIVDGARWPEGQEARAKARLHEAFVRSAKGNDNMDISVNEITDDEGNVIETTISINTPDVEKMNVPAVDVAALRRGRLRDDIIGGLEVYEDQINLGDKELPKINIGAYLRDKSTPQNIALEMEDMYADRLAFILEAMEGNDPDLKEAYAKYKKSDWNLWISWYNSLITELANYRRAKVALRKPRKAVPPEKLVGKLKYTREDTELGIKSIKPTDIIGSTQLWVYNTKTRKLGVYNANENDKTLTVKGSTILGWDPDTSVAKTLRKPKEQLDKFAAAGKVQLRSFLKNIRATEIKLNGRINAQIVLLKAYK